MLWDASITPSAVVLVHEALSVYIAAKLSSRLLCINTLLNRHGKCVYTVVSAWRFTSAVTTADTLTTIRRAAL
jgi:hypothetical protein